ncbi:MAG: class II fructose-bisphosphate aldolase [Anaerolineaceae bacterium]
MSLVNLSQLMQTANQKHFAVGAFDVFNCELAAGVIQAAEEVNSPLILAYVESFDSLIPMEAFAALLVRLAKESRVPVCIHLDHATNKPAIERAVACGFTSVMIDASTAPFEENVAITQEIVSLCHPKGVSVEAELGHVSGNTGMYLIDEPIYTDVDEAVEFVSQTHVDALAVAIGTVHGVYKSKPILSLDTCTKIKEATDNFPLVLHGGSGLSDDDFRNLIKCGINKVNIYTDLLLASLACLRQADLSGKEGYFNISKAVSGAVREEALKKILLFGSAGMA